MNDDELPTIEQLHAANIDITRGRKSEDVVRELRRGLLGKVTLTSIEARAVLLLLKSITYDGLKGEEADSFYSTLFSLKERIENHDESADADQHRMWRRIGKPGWMLRQS